MDVLTRDDAIKRVRDIRQAREIDHLKPPSESLYIPYFSIYAACAELIAIFEIEEHELCTE